MRYALGTNFGGTQQNMTTTYKTVAAVTATTGATTLRRGFIYDIMVGTDGTPADNAMTYQARRQSTLGAGTTAVPAPLDPGDAAALLIATVNHTTEPTTTAATSLLEIGVNQRASYRWIAAPGGELVIPATTQNGIGVAAKSPAYASTVTCNLHYWE